MTRRGVITPQTTRRACALSDALLVTAGRARETGCSARLASSCLERACRTSNARSNRRLASVRSVCSRWATSTCAQGSAACVRIVGACADTMMKRVCMLDAWENRQTGRTVSAARLAIAWVVPACATALAGSRRSLTIQRVRCARAALVTIGRRPACGGRPSARRTPIPTAYRLTADRWSNRMQTSHTKLDRSAREYSKREKRTV